MEGTTVSTPDEIEAWKPFISSLWENFISGETPKTNNYENVRSVFYYLITKRLEDFKPWEKMPKTTYMRKLMERSIPFVHGWWRFIIERRHLKNTEESGAPLEFTRWKWYDLFLEFKKNEEFSKLYDDKKNTIKITQQEFKCQLESIASMIIEDSEFKFKTWVDQIKKWNHNYPYSEIQFKSSENPDPFTCAAMKEMRETEIDRDIKDLSREELEYVIQSLKDDAEEHGLRVKMGKSFHKRKGESDNSDIVTLDNSNKKRKKN
jgi:hypothetical protein